VTPSVTGGQVMVQSDGFAIVNTIGTDQITTGAPLSQSNATPYLADFAANNQGALPLGFSVSNGSNPTNSVSGILLRY
jgi:hypothetical protein